MCKGDGELPASRGDVSHSLIAPRGQRKVRRLSDIHHGTWNKGDTFTKMRDSACLRFYTHTHYNTGGLCVNHSRTFVQVSQNIWLILSFYGISLHTINRKGWVEGWGSCQSVVQEAISSQITFRFLPLKILKHTEGRENRAVDFGAGRGYKCNVFSLTVWHKVYHVPKVWNRLCPESVRGKGPSLITSDVIIVGEQ